MSSHSKKRRAVSPPWETLLRVEEFACKGKARGLSGLRFHRQYLVYGFADAFRTLAYVLILLAVAIALGELMGKGADRLGGTLPLIIAFSVIAHLLTKLFERFLGDPSGRDFGLRLRDMGDDLRVIEWCHSRRAPSEARNGGAIHLVLEGLSLALAPIKEVGAMLRNAFGRVRR